MSTKIYNGFRIPACSLNELSKKLTVLRGKIEKEVERLFREKTDRMAIAAFDARACGLPHDSREGLNAKNSPKFWAFMTAINAHNAVYKTRQRNPEFDFGFALGLCPSGRFIYVTLHTEQKSLEAIWRRFPSVEEYGYWNNVDRPEKITARQWGQRRADWNRALKTAVLGFELNDLIPVPHADQPLPPIPFALRLKSVVKQKVRDAYLSGVKLDTGNIMKHLGEFEEWLAKPTGQRSLANAAAELRPKLKRRVTLKDITAEPPA